MGSLEVLVFGSPSKNGFDPLLFFVVVFGGDVVCAVLQLNLEAVRLQLSLAVSHRCLDEVDGPAELFREIGRRRGIQSQ